MLTRALPSAYMCSKPRLQQSHVIWDRKVLPEVPRILCRFAFCVNLWLFAFSEAFFFIYATFFMTAMFGYRNPHRALTLRVGRQIIPMFFSCCSIQICINNPHRWVWQGRSVTTGMPNFLGKSLLQPCSRRREDSWAGWSIKFPVLLCYPLLN